MIHTTDFIATFGVKTKWKHLMAEQKVYVPTVGEEVANAVSHGVMLCLTLAALPFAAVRAYVHDGTLAAVAASVFVISLLLMFLGSTLYHSMHPASRHKEVFHILDHIFIYVAIAGTYTPIALSVIGGWQGTFITVLQWAMVLFGIIYKSLARRSIPGDQPDDLPGDGVDDRLLHAAFRASRLDAAARADRRGRRALHRRRMGLRPQRVPLSPHGMAPAHQSGGDLPLHGHRLLPLLRYLSARYSAMFRVGLPERTGRRRRLNLR